MKWLDQISVDNETLTIDEDNPLLIPTTLATLAHRMNGTFESAGVRASWSHEGTTQRANVCGIKKHPAYDGKVDDMAVAHVVMQSACSFIRDHEDIGEDGGPVRFAVKLFLDTPTGVVTHDKTFDLPRKIDDVYEASRRAIAQATEAEGAEGTDDTDDTDDDNNDTNRVGPVRRSISGQAEGQQAGQARFRRDQHQPEHAGGGGMTRPLSGGYGPQMHQPLPGAGGMYPRATMDAQGQLHYEAPEIIREMARAESPVMHDMRLNATAQADTMIAFIKAQTEAMQQMNATRENESRELRGLVAQTMAANVNLVTQLSATLGDALTLTRNANQWVAEAQQQQLEHEIHKLQIAQEAGEKAGASERMGEFVKALMPVGVMFAAGYAAKHGIDLDPSMIFGGKPSLPPPKTQTNTPTPPQVQQAKKVNKVNKQQPGPENNADTLSGAVKALVAAAPSNVIEFIEGKSGVNMTNVNLDDEDALRGAFSTIKQSLGLSDQLKLMAMAPNLAGPFGEVIKHLEE